MFYSLISLGLLWIVQMAGWVDEWVATPWYNSTDFLKKNFLPWYNMQPLAYKKMIFMHDNANSHAARYTWEAKH